MIINVGWLSPYRTTEGEGPDCGEGHGTNSASVVDVFDPVNLCVNITANKEILSIVPLLVLKTTSNCGFTTRGNTT